MNVFYLHEDPQECAKMHLWHKHVVKMILEYAQLLSTAHHVIDGEGLKEGIYKKTHVNHPSAVWVRQSTHHYYYVYDLMMALGDIYKKRQGKEHLTINKMKILLKDPPVGIEDATFKQPPQCMPDEYKVTGDSIKAYHNYYELKKELLL